MNNSTFERISIWLIPCDEHKFLLSNKISELSKKLNSPIFEPHMTIYSGKTSFLSAKKSIDDVGDCFKPITLKTTAIETSNIFTKTLYISIKESKDLSQLSESFSKYFKSSLFSLEPHLSLAYKSLQKAERECLMRETNLLLSEMKFSTISAIHAPTQTKSEHDIGSWKVLHSRDLG